MTKRFFFHEQVGSYALMHGTGFELMDMLLCCKFAEGDSRILQLKLARDRLKRVSNNSTAEENKIKRIIWMNISDIE